LNLGTPALFSLIPSQTGSCVFVQGQSGLPSSYLHLLYNWGDKHTPHAQLLSGLDLNCSPPHLQDCRHEPLHLAINSCSLFNAPRNYHLSREV
jgi:hypothetical protein